MDGLGRQGSRQIFGMANGDTGLERGKAREQSEDSLFFTQKMSHSYWSTTPELRPSRTLTGPGLISHLHVWGAQRLRCLVMGCRIWLKTLVLYIAVFCGGPQNTTVLCSVEDPPLVGSWSQWFFLYFDRNLARNEESENEDSVADTMGKMNQLSASNKTASKLAPHTSLYFIRPNKHIIVLFRNS